MKITVTMDWWSDLWLNEGFATFMSNLALDQAAPEFRSMDTRIGSMHSVFAVDALEQSHPISVQVENPNEINSLFDSTSYDKGAAVVKLKLLTALIKFIDTNRCVYFENAGEFPGTRDV